MSLTSLSHVINLLLKNHVLLKMARKLGHGHAKASARHVKASTRHANASARHANDDGVPINETFHDEHLLSVASKELPWFADIANYLVSGILPYGMDYRQRKNFFLCL